MVCMWWCYVAVTWKDIHVTHYDNSFATYGIHSLVEMVGDVKMWKIYVACLQVL